MAVCVALGIDQAVTQECICEIESEMSQLLANFINLIALSFALCDADKIGRNTEVTCDS